MMVDSLEDYFKFQEYTGERDLCKDEIEYTEFRLENPKIDIEDTVYSGGFIDEEIYKLQNPNSLTEPSGTVYSPSLVRVMLKNYLTYPIYNTEKFIMPDLSAIPVSGDIEYNNYFSTIPSGDWLEFAETSHRVFKDSLSRNEGVSRNLR